MELEVIFLSKTPAEPPCVTLVTETMSEGNQSDLLKFGQEVSG